jgi:hypothetical protein
MTPWRFLRRWLIARAIRRHLREGARADLRATWQYARCAHDLTTMTLTEYAQRYLGWPPTEPAPRKTSPKLAQPGRQPVRMPSADGLSWGSARAWSPMPREAHHAHWEDCHTFAPGDRPKRDYFGMHGGSPLSFVCPGCELEQPPIGSSERDCPYCGLHIKLNGTSLYWWREAIEVQEWKP